MGAGDRDGPSRCADGVEQLGPAPHPQPAPGRLDDLDVVVGDGGGGGDHLGLAQPGRVVADVDISASRRKSAQSFGVRGVAAADAVAHVHQHSGDGAHARAADPDDMHPAGSTKVHDPGRRRRAR